MSGMRRTLFIDEKVKYYFKNILFLVLFLALILCELK